MVSRITLLLALFVLLPGATAAEEDPAFGLPMPADPIRGGGEPGDSPALRQGWIHVRIEGHGRGTRIERGVLLPVDCPVRLRIPIGAREGDPESHLDLRLRLIDGRTPQVAYEVTWESPAGGGFRAPRFRHEIWDEVEFEDTLLTFAEGVAGLPDRPWVRLASLPMTFHGRATTLAVYLDLSDAQPEESEEIVLFEDTETTFDLLRLSRGRGLPPLRRDEYRSWMASTDSKTLGRFTLRLAQGAIGRTGRLLMRPFRQDVDVEVGQGTFFVDPVPGVIPFGFSASIRDRGEKRTVRSRFTWLSDHGTFTTTLGGTFRRHPLTIDLPEPASVTAGATLTDGPTAFALADLADGSLLVVRVSEEAQRCRDQVNK
jgi:hypothetical protein